MNYGFDANMIPVPLRNGPPVGGRLDISARSADTWYRLVPNGNTAAKFSADPDPVRRLNIGSLRSDVQHADLHDWRFQILNDGYQQAFTVDRYVSGDNALHFQQDTLHTGDRKTIPSSGIEFALFPTLGSALAVKYRSTTATASLEFGFGVDDRWIPTNIHPLDVIPPGELFVLPSQMIHRVFFRVSATPAGGSLTWGEHYSA